MTGTSKKALLKNLILFFLVLTLAAVPLVIHQHGEFRGVDDKAGEAIADLSPEYKPWFNYVWEPPSDEVTSLIFTLQVAIGIGFIGYYIGYKKSRGKHHQKGKRHVSN